MSLVFGPQNTENHLNFQQQHVFPETLLRLIHTHLTDNTDPDDTKERVKVTFSKIIHN